MSLPVVMTDEARDDYDEAYRWIQARDQAAAEDFAEAIQEAFASLSANPGKFPQVKGKGGVRKGPVPRHRYYVIYYLPEPTQVVVFSVFHTSRDPAVWQNRVGP